MTSGAFNDLARAAIYELGHHTCIGCGRPDITAQHRRARGMGGTSDIAIGHPANGVPLCGSGTTGCHGWTEHHPHDAELLGWRLAPGQPAIGAPFWDRLYGWRAWTAELGAVYVDVDEDLDRAPGRLEALARFRTARPAPQPLAKPHR
jgi:hypothetical protein